MPHTSLQWGALGIEGTKRFIAPEILYPGRRRAVYTHKADIFSFAMFLYQLITCRHPYHNVDDVKVDIKVLARERPSIIDIPAVEAKYFYLIRLMEDCWRDNPDKRPDTKEIITKTSLLAMHLVMAVCDLRSPLSIRHCCALPHKVRKGKAANDLWVCCDGAKGYQLNIYSSRTMIKHNTIFINENQVQCMCSCNEQIWVASRPGIEYGVIDIFDTATLELVHKMRMGESSVTCITCYDSMVYVGTLEGLLPCL